MYHKNCITEWVLHKPTCPCCRHFIKPEYKGDDTFCDDNNSENEDFYGSDECEFDFE
jgi:hypothetical protein